MHCQDNIKLILLLFAKDFDNKCTGKIFLLVLVTTKECVDSTGKDPNSALRCRELVLTIIWVIPLLYPETELTGFSKHRVCMQYVVDLLIEMWCMGIFAFFPLT